MKRAITYLIFYVILSAAIPVTIVSLILKEGWEYAMFIDKRLTENLKDRK